LRQSKKWQNRVAPGPVDPARSARIVSKTEASLPEIRADPAPVTGKPAGLLPLGKQYHLPAPR
jgi:hypothetical protein